VAAWGKAKMLKASQGVAGGKRQAGKRVEIHNTVTLLVYSGVCETHGVGARRRRAGKLPKLCWVIKRGSCPPLPANSGRHFRLF